MKMIGKGGKKMDNSQEMTKLEFTSSDGQTLSLYVLEQTRVNGTDYILVADGDDEQAQAFIMKDVSDESEAQATYDMVEDDVEFNAVAQVFEELLEDEVDFEIE